MQEKQIIQNKKRIFYHTTGQGPVVMLVHGFGEDGTVWENQWQELKNFRLVIPDLPGSGKSEMTDDMSMEGMAETLRLILDQEKSLLTDNDNPTSSKGVMIAHSMGGYIALAFAEKYPDRLRGLGLFHSSAFADTEEKKQTRRKGIEFIEEHGAAEFLKTAIPKLYGPETQEKRPELISDHLGKIHNFSGAALVTYYSSMIKRPDRTKVLKEAKIPVLMILGKNDTAVPFKDGLRQAALPHLSYIHAFEKAGHMGMVEEPGKANEILRNYLTSLESH